MAVNISSLLSYMKSMSLAAISELIGLPHNRERIVYKLAVLAYRCLHWFARPDALHPGHWSTRPTSSSLSIVSGRRRSFDTPLGSWRTCFSGSCITDVELFRRKTRRREHYQHLDLNWRDICFFLSFHDLYFFLCTVTAVLCTIHFKFLIFDLWL